MKAKNILNLALLTALISMTGCTKNSGVGGTASDATSTTLAANAQFAKDLKLDDPQDFEDAKRGFVAKPTGKLLAADGSVLYDYDAYQFIKGQSPDTVNPSLWRHARLNAEIGLF